MYPTDIPILAVLGALVPLYGLPGIHIRINQTCSYMLQILHVAIITAYKSQVWMLFARLTIKPLQSDPGFRTVVVLHCFAGILRYAYDDCGSWVRSSGLQDVHFFIPFNTNVMSNTTITLTHSGFTFTIISTHSVCGEKDFKIKILSPSYRTATARIAAYEGKYNLLDIRFDHEVGLHGMSLFVETLSPIAEEVIKMVVNTYQGSAAIVFDDSNKNSLK